jgi:hypothetical protein
MNNDFDNKKAPRLQGHLGVIGAAATVLGALAGTSSRGEPYSCLRENPRSAGTLGDLKTRPNWCITGTSCAPVS